ncbi:UNVERIFIED_ORG: (deoxy)nucleoside triphosphate pyrophosphohydrolase [Bacillus sp. AZ43]
MLRLSFTTSVEAPLTVAFDVAEALGGPWPAELQPVSAARPEREQRAGVVRGGRLTLTRRFTATAAGTRVEDQVEWAAGPLARLLGRRRLERAVRAHLDGYVVAAERRALDVLQVVGAAVVDEGRVLVAQRSGGPFDGLWEFPGGKVEPGEPQLAALVRECREELGVTVEPGAFVGEVLLDGVVGGGAPGASTLRVWTARLVEGDPVAHEHAQLRWVRAGELDALDWIPADRPLLPALRPYL